MQKMQKKLENKKSLHVKAGEKVKILSGSNKGKIGIIKKVLKKQNKIIIDDINLKIKHVKSLRYNETGQIKEFAFPIHVSNVCKYED
jgi:large subunit ribosomal protein L24